MVNEKSTFLRYRLKNAPRSIFKSGSLEPGQSFHGLTLATSQETLKKKIEAGAPFAAINFGEAELLCLLNHEDIRFGRQKTYRDYVRNEMRIRAGYYPTGDSHLNEYCDLLQEKIVQADVLALSGLPMEDYFREKLLPSAELILKGALDPLLGAWTPLLAGKKVLVVSAFADDITFQYARREKIYPSESNILPAFHLQTLQAPLTMGEGIDYRFPSFLRSLEEVEETIRIADFDIALVGAGAYGNLLCLYAKTLGKMAIQSGGATQLLFGLMGKRWEKEVYVNRWVNEYWIRPSLKPAGYLKIDGGAYW